MWYSTFITVCKVWRLLEHRAPLCVGRNSLHRYTLISESVSQTVCFTHPQDRAVHSSKVPNISMGNKLLPTGFFHKVFNKIGVLDVDKYKAMTLGCLLYEEIPDGIDYTTFYREYNMPDTFLSWFLITELHVWMLMMRFMAEGKYGKVVRKYLVTAMWEDISIRTTKLGPINKNVRSDQMTQLFYQFNAAIIGYDEGIMSDDKVLAGALWRRFFRSECSDPEKLEQLLIYVRKQVNLLDQLPSQEAMSYPGIKWMYAKSIK